METRKSYEAPKLTVHGNVAELTHGQGRQRWQDFFTFEILGVEINVPAPGTRPIGS